MRGAVRACGLMVAVAAALVAFPAAAAARVHVRVSPREGSPATTFTVRFRNPVRSGVLTPEAPEGIREQIVVSAVDPQAGCVSTRSMTVRSARRGRRMRVKLGPGGSGAVWCSGRYDGSLVESPIVLCAPPAMIACPMVPDAASAVAAVMPRTITLARFSFDITGTSSGAGGSGSGSQDGPAFAGLTSATTCGVVVDPPKPVMPQGEVVTLNWSPATDPTTPSSQIVYEIFYSQTPGGEDFASPTWTTDPGATSYSVMLGGYGPAYFVVRARDAAGRVDDNTVEREAVSDCSTGG